MAKIWTDAQAAKRPDCEIRKGGGGILTGRKFARRGRKYAVVLINTYPFKDNWVEVSWPVDVVYVNGKQLQYKHSYEFTNSTSPF